MDDDVKPTISIETLEAIVSRAFGHGTHLQSASAMSGGSVNCVIFLTVDQVPTAILRIAPSDAEAASGPSWLTSFGLRREQAVMAQLPQLAPLLPETIHTDFSRTLLDRDWVVQRFVRGTAWNDLTAVMTEEQHAHVWQQTGSLARSIHDVRGDRFGLPNDGEVGNRSLRWSDVLRHDAAGFITDAETFGINPVPFRHLHAAIEHHAEVLDIISTSGMIHSDLDPRHIFLEQDATGGFRISGLIDLEFGRFSDPLSESLIVMFASDPPAPAFRESFWQGYGSFNVAPGGELRSLIYQGISLGWGVTDLARLGRRSEIVPATAVLSSLLDHLQAT